MIVCSCNVLTDHQVRDAVASGAARSAVRVHGCLGCSAQCGRCIRTIRKIMDDALTPAPCPAGCPCCAAKAGSL
jgi:bacterioferritin-associated ferredoxin